MVRFQPPSAPASRDEMYEAEEQSPTSDEGEEKATEYNNRARATKPAPTSAGQHRFAAPQLDDDDDDEELEAEADDELLDETDNSDAFDGRPLRKHASVYPQINNRAERQLSDRKPTARRIAMDDGDDTDEDALYFQQKGRRSNNTTERSASTARNDRPTSRKRFVAQDDDDDMQLIERPQPSPSPPAAFLSDSSAAYLVTPSLLFTPGTHPAAAEDPTLLLSQALLDKLPPPPASTTGLATRLPGVTDRFPRHRRAFRTGWGVDGSVAVIRGSSVTVTRVKGEEQSSGLLADELDRERQGRVDMMVAMLQVHHKFAEAQKRGLSGASASLSSARFGAFDSSSTSVTSTSPLAMLCDHYIAALTAQLIPDSSAPTSVSTSLVPARPFSVASQLRHAISVFQLTKVLYAPEYGSASLSTFLSTPSQSSPPPLSSNFPAQSLSPAAASYGERYARLHHLKEYFKQQLAPLTPVPSSFANTSAYPPLFALLSSYMVTEATELALSTRHLRLATLLPSLSSCTAELSAMCGSQVSEWQNTGVWDVMAEEERKCFLLLAGHKQADDMHWLRGLAMHVCYQTEGDGSVVKGVEDYKRAVEEGKAQPALPPYKYEQPVQRKERRRIVDDDDDDGQMQPADKRGKGKQGSHFDTRYDEHTHTRPSNRRNGA